MAPPLRIARQRGRFGFPLDKKHDFDLAFWRHLNAVESVVREFDPDILHITGPSDVGQLGTLIAQRLRIPLAASWHTNLHQYAEQRAAGLLRSLHGDRSRESRRSDPEVQFKGAASLLPYRPGAVRSK